jgi:hypothetical protein
MNVLFSFPLAALGLSPRNSQVIQETLDRSARGKFYNRGQRTVINNMVCPKGLSLPLGVNLPPRVNVHPFVYPRGEHSLLFRGIEGQTEKLTSPVGDKIHSCGTKFAPRGKVKNGPLDPKGVRSVSTL